MRCRPAGIVEQAIDTTVLLHGEFDQCPGLRLVGSIGNNEIAPRAEGLGDAFAQFLATAGDDDQRALLNENFRRALANAAEQGSPVVSAFSYVNISNW